MLIVSKMTFLSKLFQIILMNDILEYFRDASFSGTDGSQDLEASDIKAKLNSACEVIKLLKLNFETLKRSIDLSTKFGSIEALERENLALKAKLKAVEAGKDSLKLALTFLAQDMNDLNFTLLCLHDISKIKR